MPQPTITTDDHTALEPQILELVGQLVGELRPGSATAGIGLDDSLERELGLGSLERVELLARIERVVGVRLADNVMATADTPADLIRAIVATEPSAAETVPSVLPALDLATPAPETAKTLVDVLQGHVQRAPQRPHIYLRQDNGVEQQITHLDLWRQALTVATALRRRGIGRRDTIAIMLRTEAAFFPAFFGTLLAGAIPVPIYPPVRLNRIADYARRQANILSNAGTRLMITFADVERLAGLLRSQIPTLTAVTTFDELATPINDHTASLERPPVPLTSTDPALIQYTSGSTGQPKGVLLTHANLLANIRAIRDGLDIQPGDVAVSWLPLYHDMGLIGAWLGSLYVGVPVTILSPLTFLSRPARWLWAIHAHRATLSVAPNFAFDLCVNKVTDAEIEGLDLSSLRIVLNGSEAVLPGTLSRFVERFGPCGFRPDALRPVYGLAECSVGLTVTPRRHLARIDRVNRTFQMTGHAEPSQDSDAVAFVSCGTVLPKHEIRVVDGTGIPLGERREGRIQFRGPSMMAGYYRNASATRAITSDDGWLDSGDLGYLAETELFLTGRRKDVVIKGGRNIYPHEAEAVVASIERIRKGCVAAFGVTDDSVGTERLIIVAETRTTDATARNRLQEDILERVTDALGLPPDIIVLAQPGAVLKTSSGKVRRSATRDAYLSGALERGSESMTRQWLRLAWHTTRGWFAHTLDIGLRLIYTSYVAALTAILVPPLWFLARIIRQPEAVRRLLNRFSRLILAMSGCRIVTSGLEHLQDLGPAIFVANHASYLDVVVVLAILPLNIRFAAKGRLTTYPVLGTVIPRAGYISIEKTRLSKQMEGADEVSAALASGESMFVFPEGTFVRAPGLLPFRLGAFRAAAQSGCAVIPIALSGTRRIFPAGTLLLRPGPITVAIAPPLRSNGTTWSEVLRLRDEARRVIVKTGSEAAG